MGDTTTATATRATATTGTARATATRATATAAGATATPAAMATSTKADGILCKSGAALILTPSFLSQPNPKCPGVFCFFSLPIWKFDVAFGDNLVRVLRVQQRQC